MLSILVDPDFLFVDQYYNPHGKKFSPWSPALLEDDVWGDHLVKADYAALQRHPVILDRAKRGQRIILNAIERIRGLRPFAATRRAGQHG